MAHGIVIPNQYVAKDIDAYVRNAKSASDIDNGSVFNLATKSATAGEGEVWTATAPATGALTGLWMAFEPEVVVTVSGTSQYKGLDPDIRNFYNVAGNVFTAIKPQIGDIITLTADAVAGTISTNTFVVATNGALKLTWAAAAVTGLSLKLLATNYITIGTGTLGATGRVTAYQFEVVAV